jgi:hypothetical protein
MPFEIDCPDIRRHAETEGFVKGFLVVETEAELDIVAVYTTAGTDRTHYHVFDGTRSIATPVRRRFIVGTERPRTSMSSQSDALTHGENLRPTFLERRGLYCLGHGLRRL